jgi:hypothetical protein
LWFNGFVEGSFRSFTGNERDEYKFMEVYIIFKVATVDGWPFGFLPLGHVKFE